MSKKKKGTGRAGEPEKTAPESPVKAGGEGKEEKSAKPMVRLDPAIHRMIRLITAHHNEEIQDYVHKLLSPHVEREYRALFGDRPV